MSGIVKRYTFQPRMSAAVSSQLNANFDDIIDAYNNHRHTGIGTDAPVITNSGVQLTGQTISALGLIQGVESLGQSPVPTSETDITGSSVTFTLNVDATLFIIFGSQFQINSGANRTLDLNLYIDGTNTKNCSQISNPASDSYVFLSRTTKQNLAAGSHTIKLRGLASSSSTCALNSAYWYAFVLGR